MANGAAIAEGSAAAACAEVPGCAAGSVFAFAGRPRRAFAGCGSAAGTGVASTTFVTSDRFVSSFPVWSADGKWLFFLSDRNLRSSVGSVWGPMAPEPFFDNKTKVYAIALKPGTRSFGGLHTDNDPYSPSTPAGSIRARGTDSRSRDEGASIGSLTRREGGYP